MPSQPKTKRLVLALRVIMLIVAVVCTVIFVPWDIVKVWLTPVPDTVQEQVDAALGHGLDGIIVYMDKAGEAPERYAAGWKDRTNRVPADPNALFKIASISKLYIAVAAAKVISAGHLSLEDTLAELLPDLAGRIEHADQITFRIVGIVSG